jgi:large subunit ribosomal protein L16
MNLTYRKIRRYNFFLNNKNTSNNYTLRKIKQGFFGIQSLSTSFVTFKQINFIRVMLSKKLKNIEGLFFRLYIRVFLNYSITKKPPLTRMGKGSGPIKQ